jgi:hypothetical protein
MEHAMRYGRRFSARIRNCLLARQQAAVHGQTARPRRPWRMPSPPSRQSTRQSKSAGYAAAISSGASKRSWKANRRATECGRTQWITAGLPGQSPAILIDPWVVNAAVSIPIPMYNINKNITRVKYNIDVLKNDSRVHIYIKQTQRLCSPFAMFWLQAVVPEPRHVHPAICRRGFVRVPGRAGAGAFP